MNPSKLIPIELTEQEAIIYRNLREAGVFDTKNGVITLNFNAEGVLTEIRRNVLTYKRVALVVERSG